MTNLTKFTASGLFAYGIVFASKANAAAGGWNSNNTAPAGGVPTNLEDSVRNVTNWIMGFVFVIAVLIIIIGGVMYLTSAGNQDSIDRAKKTITYGIVGMIVCGLAYAIVQVIPTILGGA